jgi:hypothetical protein
VQIKLSFFRTHKSHPSKKGRTLLRFLIPFLIVI